MSAVVRQFKALSSVLMNRLNWANMAGITFGGRRDLYQILGYRRSLGYWDYRDRYSRDGIAKAIVEAYPEATWRGGVEVFEDEDPEKDTEFEQQFKLLEDRLGFWQTMQQVDILAGLSTYAVLLLGVSGDSNLAEELPRGGELLFMKPFSGGGGPSSGNRQAATAQAYDASVSIARYVVDPSDERFGEPAAYYIKPTTPGVTFLNREVHWSRVIHVAEGCLEDNVFGIPTLESVFNLLDDLAKVTGGGSEAHWLRANQGLHLDIDKDLGLPSKPGDPQSQVPGMTQPQRDALKAAAEEMQHQLQRVLVTRGVTATQLGSDVAAFGQNADAILKQIAGSKKIPMRILTGSEMGTLASEQDAANFDSRVQDRRTGYAGPKMVRRTLDRLIAYGYLVTPKQYTVGWPVEENMDEKGKSEYALGLANTNKTQGSVVFTDDEIRDMAFDLKPLTEEQKTTQQKQLPVAQPVRENANATENPDGTPDTPDSGLQPDAALVKTLKALEAAIEADDFVTVQRILENPEGINQYSGAAIRESKSAIKDIQARATGNRGRVMNIDHLRKLSDKDLSDLHKHYDVIGSTFPQARIKEELQRRMRGAAALPDGAQKFTIAKNLTRADALAEVRKHAKGDFRGVKYDPNTGVLMVLQDHKFSTTQVQLPESFVGFGLKIPEGDLAADGRETDPHVTVKYGLLTNNAEEVRPVIAGKGPITFTLGKMNYFVGEGYDVLYVEVRSGDLQRLNALVSNALDVNDSHYVYTPHATVAYLKSGLGAKYAGDATFEGQQHVVLGVVFSDADGNRTTLPC